ncbi:MAG: aldo/keto reductase [Clostridia bacterium]|nr:aldo/keto reductase [Clostridia bacterium]
MNKVSIHHTDLLASPIVLGMMRIASMSFKDAEKLVGTALEEGINHFDHADIYGRGACETLFGQVLKNHPDWREKMILQDKVGIVPGTMYDFSGKHIMEAVEGCLKRLNADSLDTLLLHRPDALMEPEEIAEAFDRLYDAGKVKHFGVSNHTPVQIELLKTCVKRPLIINQLQWSIMHTGLTDNGIHMNNHSDAAICRDGYALDYARIHKMTVQAWSPMQYGFFEGVFVGNSLFPELNKTLDAIAERYAITPSAVAVAWLLRHPTSVQVIIGTTNIQRVQAAVKACGVRLTREEWYALYQAAGHTLP